MRAHSIKQSNTSYFYQRPNYAIKSNGIQDYFIWYKKELSDIKISKNEDVIFASDENIIKNLSFVQHCDLLIGSDSVFKTMASMIKIPTIVLHQNTKNNFRDRVFIQPYLKNHMMHVYKYNNFSKQEIKVALHYVLNILSLKFNSH